MYAHKLGLVSSHPTLSDLPAAQPLVSPEGPPLLCGHLGRIRSLKFMIQGQPSCALNDRCDSSVVPIAVCQVKVKPSCSLSDRCDSRCISCVVAGCLACVCARFRNYWVSESGSSYGSNASASFWRLCNVRTLPHFVSSPYRSRSKNMVESVLVKQSDLCARLHKIGTGKTVTFQPNRVEGFFRVSRRTNCQGYRQRRNGSPQICGNGRHWRGAVFG